MAVDARFARCGDRLEIELAEDSRSSYLARGQAFFDVAKDPRRPFIVRTNRAIVEAMGTRFGVSTKDSESIVTVMEGTVAVSPARADPVSAQSESSPVTVNARQQVRVSLAGAHVVPHVEANQELAWATTIQFRGLVSVVDAVAMFNQLSGVRLELSNQGSCASCL